MGRPGPHFRIDPAHQFSSALTPAEPPLEEEATTLQLPTVYEPSLSVAENIEPAMTPERLDWVWQREPHPVFSSLEPVVETSFEPHSKRIVESTSGISSDARPLSEFSPTPQVEKRLRPQWEVDRFAWPIECESLCSTAQTALDAYVALLIMRATEGQKRVGIFGLMPGVGSTTVALCLARRAGAQAC